MDMIPFRIAIDPKEGFWGPVATVQWDPETTAKIGTSAEQHRIIKVFLADPEARAQYGREVVDRLADLRSGLCAKVDADGRAYEDAKKAAYGVKGLWGKQLKARASAAGGTLRSDKRDLARVERMMRIYDEEAIQWTSET